MDQVLARAVKYAQEGRVSRAVQALEAAQLAPATTAMLQELIALHPAAFTPRDCVRREEVKRKIAAVRKRKEWKKLDFKIFRKATMSMPRAATTWATTGLIRAVARTRLGLHKLHWMAEQLINAQPPKETWPLFFDGKMMGLDKLSGHGRSIDDLMKAAQAAYVAPGREELKAQQQVAEEKEQCPQCTGSAGEEGEQPAGRKDWAGL